MTTHLQDDLDFVRRMTEASQAVPLLGGRFYVFWGSLTSVYFVGHWAIMSEHFGLTPVAFPIMWLLYMATAAVAMPLLVRSIRRKPGNGNVGNRTEAIVWSTAGFGIFAYAIGVVVATYGFGQPVLLYDLILAIAFAGYGVAFLVTATMARADWMRIPGYLSFVSCAVVPMLAGKPQLYLFAAAALIPLSVIPGLILMRNEPKSLEEDA